jgi:hypothetical protein
LGAAIFQDTSVNLGATDRNLKLNLQ